MDTFVLVLVVLAAVIFLAARAAEVKQLPNLDAQLVCPHCQTKGMVTTRAVKLKKGISGGKAVGALMTMGVSILATGLSRKEDATEAECSNCGSVWHF